MGVLKNLGGIIKTIVSDMTGLDGIGNSRTLLMIALPFTSLLNTLLKVNPALVRVGLYTLAVVSGLGKLNSIFGKGSAFASGLSLVTQLAGKLGILTTATEADTVAQGDLDVAMDANPIGAIVVGIAALIAALVLVVTHLHTTAHVFDIFRHAVATAFDWIKAHWPLLLGIITGPIGLAVVFIVQHWHAIVDATHQAWSDIVNFLHNAWSDIVNGLHSAWSDMVNVVHSGWSSVISATHSAWSTVISVLHSAWSDIINAVSSGIRSVISFFTSLPGRITGALSALPGEMFSIGANILKGLLSGIESMVGSVVGEAEHIASDVGGAISHALHIGSPSRVTFYHGQMVGQGLIDGMSSMRPAVAAAAGRLAIAATPGGYGSAAGAAGQTLTLKLDGSGSGLDHLFMTWLASAIRSQGGDPRVLVHKVKMA